MSKWDDYRAAGRGDVLDSYLTDLSERVGLDPYYVELLRQRESGGLTDPYSAESSAGALGPLQVMPETGAEMAKKYGFDYETEQGKLEAGVRYFKEQLDRFGDPAQAAAAYHSGPGRVQGILDRGGDLSTDLGPVGRDYYSWFNQRVEGREEAAREQPPKISEPPQRSAPTPSQIETTPTPSLPQPPKVEAPTTEQLRMHTDDEELVRSLPWWQRGMLGFAEAVEKSGELPGLKQAGQLIGAPKEAAEHAVYGPLAGYDPSTGQTLGGHMADPAMKAVFEATQGTPIQGVATGVTGAAVATGVDIASDPVVWAMTFARSPIRALGRVSPALARGAITGLKGVHRLFQVQMAQGALTEIPRGIVGAVNAPEQPEGWFQIGSGTISGYMVAHPFMKKLREPKPYDGPTQMSLIGENGEWIDLRKAQPEFAAMLDRAPGTKELMRWVNEITVPKWDLLKERGIWIDGEHIRLPNIDAPEQHILFGSGARGLSSAENGRRLGVDVGHLIADLWAAEPKDRPRRLAELVHDVTTHEVSHLILESGGLDHTFPPKVRQQLGALAQEFGLGTRGILTGPNARPGNFRDYYARRRAILEQAGIPIEHGMDAYEKVSRAVEESIGQGDVAAIIAKMARVKDPQGFIEQFKVNPEEAIKGLDLSNFAKTVKNLETELAEYQRLFPQKYLKDIQEGLRLSTPEVIAETGGVAAPGPSGPRGEFFGAPPLPQWARTKGGLGKPPRAGEMEATGRGEERRRLRAEGEWEDLSGVRPGESGTPRPEPLEALFKRDQQAQREGETTKGAPPRVLHPEERGLRYELSRKERQIRESTRKADEAMARAKKIKEELGPGTVEKEISGIVDQIQERKLREFKTRRKKGMKAEGREEEPIWQRKRREAQERNASRSQRTAFMMGPPRYGSAYEKDLVTEVIPRYERLLSQEVNPLRRQVLQHAVKEARKELAALRGAKLPGSVAAEHFYAEGRGEKKEGPQVRTTRFEPRVVTKPTPVAKEKAKLDKLAESLRAKDLRPRIRGKKLEPPERAKEKPVEIPLEDAYEIALTAIGAAKKDLTSQQRVNIRRALEQSSRTTEDISRVIARILGRKPTKMEMPPPKAKTPRRKGGLAGVDWVKIYEGALAEKKAKGLDTSAVERLLEQERAKQNMRAEGRKGEELFEGPPTDRIETPEELMARAERNLKAKQGRLARERELRELRAKQKARTKELEKEQEFIKQRLRTEIQEQFRPPPGEREKVTPETSTEIIGDTFAEKKVPREEVREEKILRKAKKIAEAAISREEKSQEKIFKKDFQPGAKVEHPEFGPGEITERRAWSGNVRVRFEDPSVGTKLMSPEVLRMRKKPPGMRAEGREEGRAPEWMDRADEWAGIRKKRTALGGRELKEWEVKQIRREASKARTTRGQAVEFLKGKDFLELPNYSDFENFDIERITSSTKTERETSLGILEGELGRSYYQVMGQVHERIPSNWASDGVARYLHFELERILPDAQLAKGSFNLEVAAKAGWKQAVKRTVEWARQQFSETGEFDRAAEALMEMPFSEVAPHLERGLRAKVAERWVEANPAKYATWEEYKEDGYGHKKPIESGLDRGEVHKLVIPIDMTKGREMQERFRKMGENIPLLIEPTELRALDNRLGDPRAAKFWESWSEIPVTREALMENFNAWLGKEKASKDAPVDPGGRPKLLFHGTSKPEGQLFTRIHLGDLGYHLGDATTVEHFLAMRGQSYGQYQLVAYPVFSNMKNPLRLPDVQHWSPTNVRDALVELKSTLRPKLDELGKKKWDRAMESPRLDRLRELIELAGYDGIVYKNQFEGPGRGISAKYSPEEFQAKAADSYISWYPEQAKSAIYNIGEFSRTDPRLYRAEGRGMEASARDLAKELGEKSLIKGIRDADPEAVKKMAIEHRPEFIRSIRRAIRRAVKDTEWENIGLEGMKQRREKLPKDVREMLESAEMMGIQAEEFDRIQGIQKYDPLFEKLGAPRAIITSLDLSGILRQGIVGTARMGFRHPVTLVRMINRSIGALASEKIFKRSMEAIEGSKDYDVLKGLGVDFARHEEQFGGAKYVEGVFKKLTGGRGNFVRMSERAYTYYLNRLRYELGKKHLDSLRRLGFELDVEKGETGKMVLKGDTKVYQSMAEWINIATGRGSLPKGQDKLSTAVRSADKFLNAVFFSPRLMLSRIALLNPMTYLSAGMEMRRAKGSFKATRALLAIHGMDMVAYAGLVSATMSALQMMFPEAEMESDMTSSDFGQIRMGRTRADITGGVRTYVTAAARLLAGETKTEYGTIKPQSGWRTLANFFRGKLGPLPSLAVTMVEGRNVIGEPAYGPLKDVLTGDEPITPEALKEILKVTGGTVAESAVIPMIAADAYNLVRDNEFTPLQLGMLLSLATLGAGVTTREPPPGLSALTQQAMRRAQVEPLQRPGRINTPFRDALGNRMELKLPYMVAKHVREHSDKSFYEMLDSVVRTPSFQNLPPAAQRIAITMLLTDARQARSPRGMLKWGSARMFPKVKEEIYPKELRRLKPPPGGIPRETRWTDTRDWGLF